MARRGENIYKRSDGRYEGRYIKGRSPSGKAIYGYVYGRKYADVKMKLIDIKAGTEQHLSKITVLKCVEDWLVSETDIKITTRKIYEMHLKNHIYPFFKDMELRKLDSTILQTFINSLELSPSTIKIIFCILKAALKQAMDKGHINDVWSNVKLPKKIKSEIKVLTVQQQRKLETVIKEEKDIGVMICLYTGIRIGELCALKWNDIDLDRKLLYVRSTQARVGNSVEFLSPKSNSSLRQIPLPDFLADILRKKEKKGIWVLSDNDDYIDVRTYRRRFKKLLKKSGLPDIKFHALRHTFASRALEVGIDIKTLSEVLGHSSVATTLDLYTHSLYEYKKSQMKKLETIYNSPSD